MGKFRLIIIKFANKLTPKTTFLLSIIPIYKIMQRPKGSPNKITSEVKEQLKSLIDEVVNSITVNSMRSVNLFPFDNNLTKLIIDKPAHKHSHNS